MKKIKYIIVLIVCMIVGMGECLASDECEYYDAEGNLIATMDYLNNGSTLESGVEINKKATLNSGKKTDGLYSAMAYKVSTDDFCATYFAYFIYQDTISIAYIGNDYDNLFSKISSKKSEYSHYNPSGILYGTLNGSNSENIETSKELTKTYDYTFTAKDGSNYYTTTYSLQSFSDNTYGYCISYNSNYVCETFTSFLSIPSITIDDLTFTIPSTDAQTLFNSQSSDFYIEVNNSVLTLRYGESDEDNIYIVRGSTDSDVLGTNTYEYNSGSVCSVYVCDTDGRNCDPNGVLKAMQIVGYVIYVMKILVPIILIIMGIVDLTRGVIANDNKASSEVIMAFVRRIAVAVIIFLIPSILSFLLDLVYGVQETMTDSSAQIENCTNCLLHPLDSDTCLAEDFIQE